MGSDFSVHAIVCLSFSVPEILADESRIVDVTGAVVLRDGTTLNTPPIQKAIDECTPSGGFCCRSDGHDISGLHTRPDLSQWTKPIN